MKTFKQCCEGKTQLYGLSIKELLDTVLDFNGKTLIYFDTETMGLAPKRITYNLLKLQRLHMMDRHSNKLIR